MIHKNQSRHSRLNAIIDKNFGALESDDVDLLMTSCQRSETRMLEVVKVDPQSGVLMDVFDDLEFSPVQFPAELTPLLKRGDVFLATIGLRDSAWAVLHLSERYETDSF